jgi:hypothetical protein
MQRLATSLTIQMEEAAQLDKEIRENLAGLGFIGKYRLDDIGSKIGKKCKIMINTAK